MFLTHFRRNDAVPFQLSTSKDRSFRCFQGLYEAKSSLKYVKDNIKVKNKFLELMK